jgi:crotonobetainyl-CoA:carnitine CoA-transferase CaiB-like acyl-CoA transferase
MDGKRVPAGPIYNVEDMFADPHFRARGLFERVEIDGKPLEIPALMPRLQGTPGGTEWPGPEVGSHTDAVLGDVLGMDAQEIAALRADGVIT